MAEIGKDQEIALESGKIATYALLAMGTIFAAAGAFVVLRWVVHVL